MPDHFCPKCGTEVEADARFCPSCGTTLEVDTESRIPAAPPWPDAAADEATLSDTSAQLPLPEERAPEERAPEERAPEEPTAVEEPAAMDEPAPVDQHAPPKPMLDEPALAERPAEPGESPPPPTPPPTSAAPHPPAVAASSTGPDLPFTWPTTLSGWLMGGGAVLGAVFLLPRLTAAGNTISLLLLLALLGVAATVFLPDRIPDIPRLRLWVLAITMVGLGVGLARAAFTIQGVETLFLVCMLAAAGGALLLELDMDRPFPPADRQG
jgi:hypothetical protein